MVVDLRGRRKKDEMTDGEDVELLPKTDRGEEFEWKNVNNKWMNERTNERTRREGWRKAGAGIGPIEMKAD